MEYLSKSYVYLSIAGENFQPKELTELLSLHPTRFGLKGNKGSYGVVLKECLWEYRLEEKDALEGVDESLESLERIFKEKVPIVTEFVKKNGLRVKCFIVVKSINNEDTGVCLNVNFINFLSKLGASLEIDTYNVENT